MNETIVTPSGLIRFNPALPPKLLTAKLVKIAKELGVIPKTGWNKHFKYAFLKEKDLGEALQVQLDKANVFTFVASEILRRDRIDYTKTYQNNSEEKFKLLTDVRVEVMFSDGDSGEWIIVPGEGTGEDNSDKGTYKGITGALKYILMKSFLVSTGDDPENEVEAEEKGEELSRTRTGKGKKAAAPATPEAPKCSECQKVITPVKTKTANFTVSEWVAKTTSAFGTILCLAHTKGKTAKLNRPEVDTTETAPDDNDLRTVRGVVTGISVDTKTKVLRGKTTETKVIYINLYGGMFVTDFHTSHLKDVFERGSMTLDRAKGLVIECRVKHTPKGNTVYRNVEEIVEYGGVKFTTDKDGHAVIVGQ